MPPKGFFYIFRGSLKNHIPYLIIVPVLTQKAQTEKPLKPYVSGVYKVKYPLTCDINTAQGYFSSEGLKYVDDLKGFFYHWKFPVITTIFSPKSSTKENRFSLSDVKQPQNFLGYIHILCINGSEK